MKKITFFLFLFLLCSNSGFSKTWTITNSGLTFTPADLTITVGDTVVFQIASVHTAREVDKSTWDANGITSNGGFDLPNGGGTVVITQPGTHYYVCTVHASSGMKGTITANSATGIEADLSSVPANFSLSQNYPNPFNPSTEINFSIPKSTNVQLIIYNNLGQKVKTLLDESKSPGNYSVKFDAAGFASGIYFYRIRAGKFVETKKLVLIK